MCGEPELLEGDVFQTILPLKGIGALGSTGDASDTRVPNGISDTEDLSLPNGNDCGNDCGNDNGNDNGNDLKKNKEAILSAIRNKPDITLGELVIVTGKSKRTISRETKEMQEQGILRRIGSARAGSWEVFE